jgi:hypothetical protein
LRHPRQQHRGVGGAVEVDVAGLLDTMLPVAWATRIIKKKLASIKTECQNTYKLLK